jgi:adenylate cyclase
MQASLRLDENAAGESLPERRFGAVLAADVVGYTRLMHADETGTHLRLMEIRDQVIGPSVRVHGGRVVKSTGDGVLAEFPTALPALACALGIQREMFERNTKTSAEKTILFRIGLNAGRLIIEHDDIYGDDVNIAARLESISPPGGICASQAFFDQVQDRLTFALDDFGEHDLKNLAERVRAFGLTAPAVAALPEDGYVLQRAEETRPARSIQLLTRAARRLSIAVMPFANLSGDPDQDYFADGIVEDIITGLSRFRSLFVIARNSSFTYKGKVIDPRRISLELGARYLVQGGIQRAGKTIRITAQLIDTASAGHLWADRFDGDLSDVFSLQDMVTERVVTAIEPKVLASEIERARHKPAESLDAYDYYLRALPLRLALTAKANEDALVLLQRAIALDPGYAPALAHASACYLARRDQGWTTLTAEDVAEGLRLARAAVDTDSDDPVALCLGGHTLAGLTNDFQAGLAWIDRAVRLNQNYAEGWMRSAMVRVYANDLEAAIEHAERAMILNPVDPKIYHPLCAQGYAYLFQGMNEQAALVARRALLGRQKPEMAYRILITALGSLGERNQMLTVGRMFAEQKPDFRISAWRNRSAFTSDTRLDTMECCLREAGLPN